MKTLLKKLKLNNSGTAAPKEPDYVEKLMTAAGCDKAEAQKKLQAAEMAGISEKRYIKQELFLVPDDKLKSVKKLTYVDAVAKKYDMTIGKTYTIMADARERYQISYELFAVKDLMEDPTDEAYQKLRNQIARRDQRLIQRLCNVTGKTEEEVLAETARVKEKFGFSMKKYYIFQLYQCTDEELQAQKDAWDAEKKERQELIMRETGWSAFKVKKHMNRCKVQWGIDAEHYMLFKAWELTDEQLASYVTIKTSRMLNAKYNRETQVLKNKVEFNKGYKEYIQRKFWINEEDATFESFCAFADGLDEIFCKPLDLSRGRGAERVKIAGNERALYDEFMSRPKFLAEEFVKQHSKMNEVYDGSVNTVRMVNLQEGDVVHALCSFVRFGCGGVIDGLGGGGMIAAVDVETGKVVTPAINSAGESIEKHPLSGVEIVGFQIPHWDKVREITDHAMRAKDNINYIGWDIAICEDKVVIIEGNSGPDLGAYQSPYALLKEGKQHIFDAYL
ncbi:MAG: hypothetical protein IKJ77_06705 [Firmicutes bacterium]|nr:hypothetical protein [Bacillota bacterium]